MINLFEGIYEHHEVFVRSVASGTEQKYGAVLSQLSLLGLSVYLCKKSGVTLISQFSSNKHLMHLLNSHLSLELICSLIV